MSSSAASDKPAGTPAQNAPFDFLDLRAQFATIQDEVMQAVTRVFESQYFILGPEVKLLEEEVAAKLGARFAVGCASGTDALILALLAEGIGEGDEVVTTPFSFVATAGAIAYVGAKPVFVDIEPVTFNINPELLQGAITPRTRAVLPVHLFGLPADLDAVLAVAKKHNLVVIEDAAQAIGARYSGEAVGTFGEYGCFSFFPSKNLGGAGDGGLITTNDAKIAERLQMLRVHGSRKKYFHEMVGTNSRLHALQAAVLRVKLRHLDAWQKGRQGRAERYRQLFAAAGLSAMVSVPPQPAAKYEHVYNQFTIRSARRDELKAFLQAAGVPSEIYYPLCLHLQGAFRYLGYGPGSFPEAERASGEVLSLPVYPELPDVSQERVVEAVREFYRA
jgi:dTDP-4-amino-4,6-dideoxygalactose transaminase